MPVLLCVGAARAWSASSAALGTAFVLHPHSHRPRLAEGCATPGRAGPNGGAEGRSWRPGPRDQVRPCAPELAAVDVDAADHGDDATQHPAGPGVTEGS